MNTCEQTYSLTPYDSFQNSPMNYTTPTITPFNDSHRTLYCKTQSRDPLQQQQQQQPKQEQQQQQRQQQQQQQQKQEYNRHLDNHSNTTNRDFNDTTENRRQNPILQISSLLCPAQSPPTSDASFDDDDMSSNESIDSRHYLKGCDASSTPGSSPPLSPDAPNGRDFSPYNYEQTIGGPNHHHQNNQKLYNVDEPGFCNIAKHPRMTQSFPQIALPSIRSLPDLRSEFNREDMSRRFSPSSQLPSINLDPPKPWHQMQRLEQFAVISEAYRSDHYQEEPRCHMVSKPFSSPSLANMYHDEQQLLRRSSIATPSPYPPARLPPFLDQRRHSDSPLLHSERNQAEQKRSNGLGWDSRHLHSNSPYTIPNSSSAVAHHAQIHHHHHQLYAPYHDPSSPNGLTMVKAKRKRANASQLKVLNQVFQHTFFPSTELRIQLGKQLSMSPRTVQIWFQNKRQSWRSKTRAVTGENGATSANEGGQDDQDHNNEDGNNDTATDIVVSRRSSNSSLTSDEDQGQRSIPDSPLDGGPYPSRSNCFGNENASGALQHQNGDYFNRNYNGGVTSDHVHQPNNERLPGIVSSFAYSSIPQPHHHTEAISTTNQSYNYHY